MFLFDAVAAVASYLIGRYIRLNEIPDFFGGTEEAALLVTLIYVVILLLSGYFCELYTGDRYMNRSEMGSRIAVSVMLAFFVLSAVFYAAPEMALGRGVLSLSLLFFGVTQYLIHRSFQGFQNHPSFAKKIMILGTGPLAAGIAHAIPASPHNFAFAGFIQPENDIITVPEDRIVGKMEQIESLLSAGNINKLVISMTERRGTLPV